MFVVRSTICRFSNLRTFISECVGRPHRLPSTLMKGFGTDRVSNDFANERTGRHFLSKATDAKDATIVEWADGAKSSYHHIWLRDHCRCSECYNSDTNQKELNLLDIADVIPKQITVEKEELIIAWQNDHVTRFDTSWLRQHSYDAGGPQKPESIAAGDQYLWNKELIESNKPPHLRFEEVLQGGSEWLKLCKTITRFGFAFVSETPTEVKALQHIAEALGGFVRPTHYGTLWEFSNEVMEHEDTAYTADYLRGHTDNTYFTDPAGLQLLHCVGHEGTGGMSLLVDGFHVAEKLRQENYQTFQFLTSKVLPFQYIGEKLHLKAHGPIIEMHPFTKDVSHIRYNTYDMGPLTCLSYEDVPKCYVALKAFTALTCTPENQYWFKLVPGTLLIAGNWRVLHGRSSFTGKRTMQGCYVNRDDFLGKFRAALKKAS